MEMQTNFFHEFLLPMLEPKQTVHLDRYLISRSLATKLKMVSSENGSLSFGEFTFMQPEKLKLGVSALKPATYKDVKLVYDKIRLLTWCEDIKFTLITPGTYLEFDDI